MLVHDPSQEPLRGNAWALPHAILIPAREHLESFYGHLRGLRDELLQSGLHLGE